MGSSATKYVKQAQGKGKKKEGNGNGHQELGVSWDEVLKSKLGVEERKASSSVKSSDNSKQYHFACAVQGYKKDQDRFIVVPELVQNPRIFFGGVFDGHGRDGDQIAETVAVKLPRLIRDNLLAQSETGSAFIPEHLSKSVNDAFCTIQGEFDEEFERDVVIPTKKLKSEIEQAQKVSLGALTLPLGSGCTATTFIIHDDVLKISHVGDSRAVLARARSSNPPAVDVSDLTMDHNVAGANQDEIDRVRVAGATLTSRHLASDFVDGMLQLTRSLGDVPLHRSGVVLHKPEMKQVPIGQDTLFAIAASDGLWDSFSSEEACEEVFTRVSKAHQEDATKSSEDLLLDVAYSLIQDAGKKMCAKGHKPDDISVMIIALNEWWTKEATLQNNEGENVAGDSESAEKAASQNEGTCKKEDCSSSDGERCDAEQLAQENDGQTNDAIPRTQSENNQETAEVHSELLDDDVTEAAVSDAKTEHQHDKE
mmetsp:Transcript_12234/g.21818  ORF Transcript_12234/g.21818 Transcript_12234/m.21818 type:complete len:481 (+) Transcript_12234:205-1647(+)|eukprot:CAMPEP_0184518744 /NCGR_PEP_ID=MMETSP0198_2-20121128/6244_1 /TAXON_ID=1112570 /ORGANISM="Thraustochytrium sp., Strain LLF1b" /LENGTH=480 /DNA_ID=CAMNT_0026909189 /DNA_START=156 /DNA_END=1598 /DNA_ORIENTATION=+